MTNKIVIAILVVAVIALGGLYLSKSNTAPLGSSGSTYMNTLFAKAGLVDGGAKISYASTTATSYTATVREMEQGKYLSIATSSKNSALSFNLPSASELGAILPVVGDTREWFIANDTASATLVTTIVAGSGVDLQEPDDGSDFNVIFSDMGWLKCARRSASVVTCLFTESTVAD